MEIRVLRYFLEVARTGNITHAAERLHITQPTLSRQLKDLETELGKKLFVQQLQRAPNRRGPTVAQTGGGYLRDGGQNGRRI